MSTPIVTSLIDTDLYKLTMQQVVLHQFPATVADYEFKCRNESAFPLAELKSEIDEQLDMLCELRFQPEELEFLDTKSYFKSDYIDYLETFQLRRKFIHTEAKEDGSLRIYSSGPMLNAMMFEIHVLEIVQELYFKKFWNSNLELEGKNRLTAKIEKLKLLLSQNPACKNPFELFEFGARRRASSKWQEYVLSELVKQIPTVLKGSSNVLLAKKYGLVPIGTMAHEYMQAHQALGVQLIDFQKQALENWVHEYRGDLGIALTDTVGMDVFIRDFDLFFAKLFDGLRHDSGDPYEWGEKALVAYAKLKIDANTKRFVFSDSLNFEKAFALYQHFGNRVQTGFGIGTDLSNDLGIKPLNLVMKMVKCNNRSVAKLSDSPGKIMCEDQSFLDYMKYVFKLAA